VRKQSFRGRICAEQISDVVKRAQRTAARAKALAFPVYYIIKLIKKHAAGWILSGMAYHHCGSIYSLWLMIYIFGDELHANA